MTTKTDLKNLFDRYEPSHSEERNINSCLVLAPKSRRLTSSHASKFFELLRMIIQDIVSKLWTPKSGTKSSLASEIVTFIRATRESWCRKCSAAYSPYHTDNSGSNLSCFSCKLPSHSGCFTDSPGLILRPALCSCAVLASISISISAPPWPRS